MAEGTVDDLRGEDALIVGADPIARAREIVSGVPGVGEVMLRAGVLRIAAGPDAAIDAAWLNARLVAAGIAVRELRRERASLESVFLDLTGTALDRNTGDASPHGPAKGRHAEPRVAAGRPRVEASPREAQRSGHHDSFVESSDGAAAFAAERFARGLIAAL